MKRSWGPVPSNRNGKVIDLERYAPASLTYMSCAAGTEVTLCTAPSANHCGSYGLAKIVDTSWTLFQKQALP